METTEKVKYLPAVKYNLCTSKIIILGFQNFPCLLCAKSVFLSKKMQTTAVTSKPIASLPLPQLFYVVSKADDDLL